MSREVQIDDPEQAAEIVIAILNNELLVCEKTDHSLSTEELAVIIRDQIDDSMLSPQKFLELKPVRDFLATRKNLQVAFEAAVNLPTLSLAA